MKTPKKLSLCIAASLLCFISCTKEKTVTATSENTANDKFKAHTSSSVVSYSKDATTTVTSINTSPGYQKVVMYSIGPLTVSAADVVSAHFQQQLQYSGTSYPVMAACGIVVGTNASVVDVNSPGYIGMISKFAGSNLTAAEINNEVLTRSGSYKFDSASGSIYINAVVYAAAGDAPFNVPAGPYGELVAVVESGVSRYETMAYQLDQFVEPHGITKYGVPTGGTQYLQYTLGPLNIPASTMVDIRYQYEATAELDPPCPCPSQQIGRSAFQATSSTATTGTTFIRQMQSGVTNYEHHHTATQMGGLYYGTAISNAYFNTAMYSYGGNLGPMYIETETSTLYGGFAVEMRPMSSSTGFKQDLTRRVTSVDATPRVVYSVGPIDIAANQVVEIRYQAAFAPNGGISYNARLIRATSPTSTTGTTVQPALVRRADPTYTYNSITNSTAERPSTALTGQYYNLVISRNSGATTLPVLDWGEIEAVKR